MMRWLAALLTCCLSTSALAQTGTAQTPSQLNSEITNTLPDNSAGAITPAILRQVLVDMVASANIATAGAGQIAYYDSTGKTLLGNTNATLTAGGVLSTTGYTSPGFAVSGTGNVTALSISPPAPCTSIAFYGGKGDGSTDNSAALIAAYTAIGASNGCISFPPGTFIFSTNGITKSMTGSQAISLVGSGMESTILSFPNSGNGLIFNYTGTGFAYYLGNGLSVKDLAVVTPIAQAGGGSAITVNGASIAGTPMKPTLFDNISIRASASTAYWSNGLLLNDTQEVVINNYSWYGKANDFLGRAIAAIGTTSFATPNVITINNMMATYAGEAVLVQGYYQGLTMVNTNLTGVDTGVYWNSTGLQPQCSISNSQIAARTRAIRLTNCVSGAIANNLVYVGTASTANGVPGIDLTGTIGVTITGNNITGNANGGNVPNCIILEPTNANTVISNNNFNGCATNIWLTAGNINSQIYGNSNQNGTPVLDQSGVTSNVGVNVGAVAGNAFSSPGFAVDGSGNVTTGGTVTATTTGTTQFRANDTTHTVDTRLVSLSGAGIVGTWSASPLLFNLNGNERMRLQDTHTTNKESFLYFAAYNAAGSQLFDAVQLNPGLIYWDTGHEQTDLEFGGYRNGTSEIFIELTSGCILISNVTDGGCIGGVAHNPQLAPSYNGNEVWDLGDPAHRWRDLWAGFVLVDGGVGVGTGSTNPAALFVASSTAGGIVNGYRATNTSLGSPSINFFPGTGSPVAGVISFGDGSGWEFHFRTTAGADVATLLDSGVFKVVPLAFASLATCAAGNEGSSAAVNNSTTNTWGATITGGGANHVLAYCDGTNWTVAGK